MNIPRRFPSVPIMGASFLPIHGNNGRGCPRHVIDSDLSGRSVHGDVLQADARPEQSRERLENLRAQIDSDVRTALFNLQSSADPGKRGAHGIRYRSRSKLVRCR